EGDMKTVPGASRLQMRFSVQVHGDGGWHHVPGPNLDVWVSSLPGRTRYVYDKHVTGLQLGVAYRVLVRFRWRSASGAIVRSALRFSHTCKVPDPRPDLQPVRVEVRPGSSPGTSGYLVTIA